MYVAEFFLGFNSYLFGGFGGFGSKVFKVLSVGVVGGGSRCL